MAIDVLPYHSYRWEDAPFSHWSCPIIGVVVYLILIAVLGLVMRSREPMSLRSVTALHNFILSIGSLVMFVGTCYELRQRYISTGTPMWLFCEYLDTKSQGPLFFWSYVYYLSKYYEMLDTVLVMLQKSKVPHFSLQVYHHAAVVPMAWLWCHFMQSLMWPGLLFNTLVHVVMYHYYACKVLGWKTPWKRYITGLQIVQFVTGFSLLLFATVPIWLEHRMSGSTCGGMESLGYNCIFNLTLLLQFIEVFKKGGGFNGKATNGKSKDTKDAANKGE